MTVSADSSKFHGFGIEAPPQGAASAAKVLGGAALSPTLTAVTTAKFLAYVILNAKTNLAIAATESSDSMVAALGVQDKIHIAATESADALLAAITGPHSIHIGAQEIGDSIYISLGYRLHINISTEDADRAAIVLKNSGSWNGCPDASGAWANCIDESTNWTNCTPKTSNWSNC